MTNEKVQAQNEKVQVQNEVVVQDHQSTIVKENDHFAIHRSAEGKYSRKAKYTEFSSVVSETRADKIWLLNLLEGVEDTAIGLKDAVGEIIEVQDVIIRPYDSINEDTGEFDYGVLTYLITPEKQVYVTSAKAVYFSVKRIMEVFGKPNTPEWENIRIVVTKTKMENGDAINIKMVE